MEDLSKKYPLVCVCWADIVNFGRLSLEEIEEGMEDHMLYKKEVGYLVKETDDYVVVVNDLDLTGGSDNYGSLIIKGCICSIEYLESTDEYIEGFDNEL